MDKDHLIELISNSFPYESKNSESTTNFSDFKIYIGLESKTLIFLIRIMVYKREWIKII